MSNGEIWLTLAYYTDLFPDDHATAAIVAHIDNEMLRTYVALSDTDYYSWGVKAAAQRLETTSDAKFRQFIAAQTQAYFDHLGPASGPTDNSCADVEGLATALRVLSARRPLSGTRSALATAHRPRDGQEPFTPDPARPDPHQPWQLHLSFFAFRRQLRRSLSCQYAGALHAD